MEILYVLFVAVVTIYALCSIYEFNQKQFDVKNIVTHMGLWMAANLCALIIGATLIGSGPTVSYDFTTHEYRTATSEEIRQTTTTVKIGDSEHQIPTATKDTTSKVAYKCNIRMELNYRFMVVLGSKSFVSMNGRCDEIDSIVDHPQVVAVLSGWGVQ